jgi:hypothetical protein
MGAYYGYYRNRSCTCARCRVRTAMGPAILITIGVLFLLQTMDIMEFHYTWPVILIIIGAVQIVAHSASTEGHVQPGWWMNRTAQGAPLQNPPAPVPPPTSQSGAGGSNV